MDLLTGLEWWLSLDEASGSRVDSHNAYTFTDNNTVTSTTGKQGNAAQFTATTAEYLSIADSAALSTGDIDFTVCGWAKFDNLAAVRNLAAQWIQTGNQRSWLVHYDNASARLELMVSPNGVSSVTRTAATFGAITTATWYFIAAWHDAANDLIGIRVNDTAADTTAHATGTFDSSGMITLGYQNAGATYHWGAMDEWAFWKNRVLDTTELDWLYNSGSGRSYSDVTAAAADSSSYSLLNFRY